MNSVRLGIKEYKDGILNGDRVILAKAITLIESKLPEDQAKASELLEQILPYTGNSIRIGITGVPGVGKSTFIEAFGEFLTTANKKIAVLTIDPSSQITKGSILGDKTRMEGLSKNKHAFIRSTASGQTLGGVAQKTREAMLLCEATGFEVILIETVGVGQSEVSVKNMVDFFLLLMLAGAGDELQGIKKGIMEMADAIIITKADGDNAKRATEAQAEYQQALHLSAPKISGWNTKVLTCSALTKKGIDEVWTLIDKYASKLKASGFFKHNRQQQATSWFNEYFEHLLKNDFARLEKFQQGKNELESRVASNEVSPQKAAQQLLALYHTIIRNS